MSHLSKTLESLVDALAVSQREIVARLDNSNLAQSLELIERAGKNLKEMLSAYEAITADQDLMTAEQVMESKFFPEGTMSIDKLYRLVREKKIPAIRFDSRVFFSRKALKEFIQETCRKNVVNLDERREEKGKRKRTNSSSEYVSQITAIPE